MRSGRRVSPERTLPRVDIRRREMYNNTVFGIIQKGEDVMESIAAFFDGIADFFSSIFMSILVFFNGGKLF